MHDPAGRCKDIETHGSEEVELAESWVYCAIHSLEKGAVINEH